MTTIKEIIENGSFTDKESEVLRFLNEALKDQFGDTFTDVDTKDIVEGLNIETAAAKGIISSLIKKNILGSDHFTGGDGKNYECFYFVKQEDLEYQPF